MPSSLWITRLGGIREQPAKRCKTGDVTNRLTRTEAVQAAEIEHQHGADAEAAAQLTPSELLAADDGHGAGEVDPD